MHNDEPTLLDALDRGPLIREVGDAVATCAPPQVFGVHGDWGLGKTSFLHQVQWYLTGDCPQQSGTAAKKASERKIDGGRHSKTIQAVWFDAWRYQNEDAPIVALLHEMRAHLSWRSRAVRSASRSVEVAARGALLSMDELTKKIGIQYSRLRQAEREWESENLASVLPSHTLREHLQKAIGQLLPRGRKNGASPRLAVFIDDVDRCEPEAAYRLLEGLKIYLTLDNCVFVLGMNQKAIEEAIATRMGSDARRMEKAIEEAIAQRMRADARRDARRMEIDDSRTVRAAAYMEKLCQNVWRLPAVREPDQVLYDLLAKTIESETVREWIKRAVQGHRCLPPNPRRLKGLANLLGRFSSRLPSREDTPDNEAVTRRREKGHIERHRPAREGGPNDEDAILEARLLVIVAYVYQFHHDLYVRWEADSGLYKRIYEWSGGNDVDLPFLKPLVLPKRKLEPGSGEGTPLRQDEVDIQTESTYPDPTEAGVFWIQPLILALGNEVDPSRFKRYLHGAPA